YNSLLDDKGKKYIFFATDGAKRMKDMIADLLEYSRVGRIDGLMSSINLNKLVKDTLSFFQESIKEKDAKIIIHPLPTIKSYNAPLSQIFRNLISNSLKYSRPDCAPIIEIRCVENEDHWKFSVKDNGIGIEEEFHDRVFNLFQKLHHKRDYGGTGIGLAIVKKCVENLGGKIMLESDIQNGSVFSFTLTKNC
ncbi:MAG: histidine kinase, partial [Mongoliibacter sp.]|uniref:sensor histidine kinase n=1 Tax=Mongoliibacter sp. TaxID=2022438 RepID=UPI0012F276CC